MTEVDEKDVLDGEALDDLYKWIDAVPLSRPKKNIARDFSDGVMVAEIIHHYLPSLRAVELHNYVAANSSGQKRINWNTLNRKVFSKINLKFSENTQNQVIESKPGAIEQILWDLRQKIIEHAGMNPKSTETLMTASSNSAILTETSLDKKSLSTRSSRTLMYSNNAIQKASQHLQGARGPPISKNSTKMGGSTQSSKASLGYSLHPSKPSLSKRSQGNIGGTILEEQAEGQPGDSNESSSGNPPSQIIFRGHKMVAVELLEIKEKEIKDLENIKKQLSTKIDRMDKLIGIKDERIKDLTHRVHNLRSMYERVTQTTWDESKEKEISPPAEASSTL